MQRLAGIAFTLLLVCIGAQEHTRRLERAAERQVLQQLGEKGTVRVHIEPRWGALGVLLARADSILVEASHFQARRMPFFTETPVQAWQGEARRVRIVMRDFCIAGLPIRHFEASIPRVKLDSRAAAFRLRVRLFDASWGEGWVVIDEGGLRDFVKRRLPEVRVSDVRITPSEVSLEGELLSLLVPWRFSARGTVQVQDGRRLALTNVQLHLEGESLSQELVQKVVNALNPILDIERDMLLASAFIIEQAELHDGFIKLRGRATVPPRELGGSHVHKE